MRHTIGDVERCRIRIRYVKYSLEARDDLRASEPLDYE